MINFIYLIARNKLAFFGGVFLSFIILICLLTPLLPLYEPNVIDTPNRFKLPLETKNILGTDHLGRDLLSRLLWGTRLSLLVGFAAALIAAVIGSILGAVAGYYGNRTDNIIMRLVDVLMAFPYILLALAIVAALGPGLFNAMIAVALVNIPFFARNIRGVTVTIANKEYIDANYGGVFIIWDRMFGTFEPEEEPVTFGLVNNVNTFNPAKITFMAWSSMIEDIKNKNDFSEMLNAIFGPPNTHIKNKG